MQKNKPIKLKLSKSHNTFRQFRELISIILGMFATITTIAKNIIDISILKALLTKNSGALSLFNCMFKF